MIEHLEGVRETVDYRGETNLRLYDNTDYEEYPPHWHICCEIIMPVSGTYRVDYEGRESVTLNEGDILFICPAALHHLYASKGERYILQINFGSHIPLQSAENLLHSFYPAVLVTPETMPDIHRQCRELISQIAKEYLASPPLPLFDTAIYAMLLQMMVLIGRSHPVMQKAEFHGVSKQREYMDKFTQLCEYLAGHCAEDLSLDDAARSCGFSKYHFSRLFHEFTGTTYYKYLNQKRIESACRMLTQPDLSVTDVAIACGFTSMSSFIRMFRLLKGMTPSQFRAMYTKSTDSFTDEET